MSGMRPLVSVVVCTYNGERFLKDQLDSLVDQSYTPVEIIIVDDCSTDGSFGIASSYGEKYSQIRLYQNPKNIGYIKNFEKAITLSKGEYIALCDQDDVWDREKVHELIKQIKSDVLIYHDSQFIDEEGHVLDKKLSDVVNLYAGDKPEAFVFFNCISSHAVMFKRELIDHLLPFPSSGFHDAWIGYVACNLGTISFMDRCLVQYRQHQSSATDILKRKGQVAKPKRATRYENKLNFIKSCSELPINKRPEIIDKLYRLYQERRKKRFSYSLMLFFLRHYRTLFFIYKKSFFSKINFILKHSRRITAD